MKATSSFRYTGKIWLVTVLVSPVVLLLTFGILSSASLHDMEEASALLFMMILYGMVLSLPSFFLSWWIVSGIKGSNKATWVKKAVIAGSTIAMILITYISFDPGFFVPLSFQNMLWPGAYIVTLLIAVYSFRLPARQEETTII